MKLVAALDARRHRADCRSRGQCRGGRGVRPGRRRRQRRSPSSCRAPPCCSPSAPLAVVIGRRPRAHYVVYGVSLAASLIACHGRGAARSSSPRRRAGGVTLPLGLPWLGAHFRIDALAAFFSCGGRSRPRRRACSRSATGATSRRRCACAVHPPSSPVRTWSCSPTTPSASDLPNRASLSSWALVMAHHACATTCRPATSIW